MRNWMLAASAAALAITAPALAQQGQGRGGGKDKAAHVERGGGQKAEKSQQRGDRGGEHRQMKANRGPDRERGKAFAQAQRDDHRAAKSLRVEDGKGHGRDRDDVRFVRADKAHKANRDLARVRDFDDDDIMIRRAFDRDLFPGRGRGLIAGCPPGLAKKNNGCMPPGQVKHLLGAPLAKTAFANSQLPYNYRNWYRDDDDYFYRAGDGFIYRVDRDRGLIDGLIPLAMGGYGGYYAMGDPWPDPYNFYNVPYQYRSQWADNDDYLYRYGNGAIYAVDKDTMLVNSIVSLLAGDLGVGSRLPMGYDVYNVPMAYRANYYDTPDAWYRYNDGYVYRVDPKTRLITAVIDALI